MNYLKKSKRFSQENKKPSPERIERAHARITYPKKQICDRGAIVSLLLSSPYHNRYRKPLGLEVTKFLVHDGRK